MIGFHEILLIGIVLFFVVMIAGGVNSAARGKDDDRS